MDAEDKTSANDSSIEHRPRYGCHIGRYYYNFQIVTMDQTGTAIAQVLASTSSSSAAAVDYLRRIRLRDEPQARLVYELRTMILTTE